MKFEHLHHHRKKFQLSRWIKHNNKLIVVFIIVIIFLLAFLIDRKTKKTDILDIQEATINEVNNYDAIITVIDGEGETSFTEVWGEIIQEGYPICSDIVNDFVGKDGFMDWETIEALDDIGVEFIYHSSSHISYADISKEEIEEDIIRGVKEMEEHGLNHRIIHWRAGTQQEKCEVGKKYFDGGITNVYASDVLNGDRSNPMMIQDYWCYDTDQYYTYNQLVALINTAVENNGWLVIFTRNNYMDSTQIDIYRQAFEYAKEHNVAVVTASEGYDLYYGNKLGNSK